MLGGTKKCICGTTYVQGTPPSSDLLRAVPKCAVLILHCFRRSVIMKLVSLPKNICTAVCLAAARKTAAQKENHSFPKKNVLLSEGMRRLPAVLAVG